jgi:hypothetical protein
MSFEVVIPFLRPIEHLLESETISEIMVNPDSNVWVEEDGRIQSRPGIGSSTFIRRDLNTGELTTAATSAGIKAG